MPRYNIYAGDRTEVDRRFNEIMESLGEGYGPKLKQFVVERWGVKEKQQDIEKIKEEVKRETLFEVMKLMRETTNRIIIEPDPPVIMNEDSAKIKEAEARVGAMADAWD